MQNQFPKKVVIAVFLALLIIAGIIVFFHQKTKPTPEPVVQKVEEKSGPIREVIGKSVEGREIESYTFGKGETRLAFVGGVHGGYEWNSALLAYQFIDYLKANPKLIPENLTVTIIPSANPDGVYKITKKDGYFVMADVLIKTDDGTGIGRFNANNVDLNRNFDCKWKPESMWRSKIVSAGTSAFSEPESMAIKNFVLKNKPSAVIFWHSQANSVYASECQNGILPETLTIMNKYSLASGYKAVQVFDSYEVTGDAEGWLASIGIPAITVEMQTHETIEWDRNLAGVKALLDYFGSKK